MCQWSDSVTREIEWIPRSGYESFAQVETAINILMVTTISIGHINIIVIVLCHLY